MQLFDMTMTDRQTDRQTDFHCHLQGAVNKRDAARFRSVCGRGSGSWLEAVPSSEKLALNPSEFRLAALMRIGRQSIAFWKLAHAL